MPGLARLCPELLGFASVRAALLGVARRCLSLLGSSVACIRSGLADCARCLLDMLGFIRLCLVFLASCFCSLGFVIRRCKLNGVAWLCLGWTLVLVWITGLRLGLVGFARLALNLPRVAYICSDLLLAFDWICSALLDYQRPYPSNSCISFGHYNQSHPI